MPDKLPSIAEETFNKVAQVFANELGRLCLSRGMPRDQVLPVIQPLGKGFRVNYWRDSEVNKMRMKAEGLKGRNMDQIQHIQMEVLFAYARQQAQLAAAKISFDGEHVRLDSERF